MQPAQCIGTSAAQVKNFVIRDYEQCTSQQEIQQGSSSHDPARCVVLSKKWKCKGPTNQTLHRYHANVIIVYKAIYIRSAELSLRDIPR